MIQVTNIWNQSVTGYEIPVTELNQIAQDEDVIRICDEFRKTHDNKIKNKLPALMASGKHFWIDIDGPSHEKGNESVDVGKIAALIPHVAQYVSPSGNGMKILVEINREPSSDDERKAIARFLIDSTERITGYKCDHCRTNIAFASNYPVKFSDGIFHVPVEQNCRLLQKRTSKRQASTTPTIHSHRLSDLIEMMDYFPHQTDYNIWIALVMATLRVYGERAIPLLEEKWESETPYETILRYSHDVDTTILEVLWENRTRINATSSSRNYRRRVITGATGAGKSQLAIAQIKRLMLEGDVDAEYGNYVIYVVPSVVQAFDFAKKLEKEQLSFEILVSNEKYLAMNIYERKMVQLKSTYNKMVKIIPLKSLMRNSYIKYTLNDTRRLCTIYIDELTITDFVRPSINSNKLVKAYSGIKSDDDAVAIYKNNFSDTDLDYAMKLSSLGDSSNFVSSMLYQNADTTVMTTEEVTTACLEYIGFEKLIIKAKETKELKDTCTLHVAVSPNFVLKYSDSESLARTIREMKFDNVFANNCKFNDGNNLVTIKGQQINGRNLTIIRNLPKDNASSIKDLFEGCFKTLDINPLGLYYKDVLMQAVGRSIGFRGDKEAWVMVHSQVWDLMKDSEWIYNLVEWDVEIDEALVKEIEYDRLVNKELYKDRSEVRKQWKQQDKEAKIHNRLEVTGNPNDKLYSSDVKLIFGSGFTLKDVEKLLKIKESRNKSTRWIQGVKKSI